jgi:hypothetical protein
MTGTLYRLLKERRTENERISSAGAKQSLWSKVGGGLLGALAIGLTGGAATPLVAAAMAGGGTLAGGLIGRALARGTKGGRIRSGRFYKDEAKDLIKSIGSNIWSSALSSGVQGGLGALAKGFSFGKEGLKFTSGAEGAGVNPADLLGKDVPAAAGGYSDSLWGKLGEAIDYKGSFVGKGIDKFASRNMISSIAEDEADDFLFETGESAGYGWKPEAPAQGSGLTFDDPGQYYRRSLAGAEGVLEPLSQGVARPVTGTGQGVDQDIMGALMEGYNTPTGQGYDPGDEIFRQDMLGSLRWQNRLFGD